jgi:hypothetical protein
MSIPIPCAVQEEPGMSSEATGQEAVATPVAAQSVETQKLPIPTARTSSQSVSPASSRPNSARRKSWVRISERCDSS